MRSDTAGISRDERDDAMYARDDWRFWWLPRRRQLAVWRRVQEKIVRGEEAGSPDSARPLWPRDFGGKLVPRIRPGDEVVAASWWYVRGAGWAVVAGLVLACALLVAPELMAVWPWSSRLAVTIGMAAVGVGLMAWVASQPACVDRSRTNAQAVAALAAWVVVIAGQLLGIAGIVSMSGLRL